jgi:carboxypeptidase family protein
MKTMRRRTKTGSRLLVLLAACSLMCAGAGKKPVKKSVQPYAVVAGTVFRDSGLSLAGATVTLAVKDDLKTKRQQAVSDARGEFAFHVPVTPAIYVVRASLKGFHSEEKEAAVGGEGRVDVTFMLAAESK